MAPSEESTLSVPNGSSGTTEQYRPDLTRQPPGDFMRPAMRTKHSHAKTNGVGVQVEDTRICVVMVGLPARGKSLIASKGVCCNPRMLSLEHAFESGCKCSC